MMTQNAELERAKRIIRKTLDRTTENGCSESEAMDSMALIGQFLEKFNLSITDIDLTSEEFMHHVVEVGGKVITPVGHVLIAITKLCDCRVWMDRKPQTRYHIYGMETDVDMAV
jgi:hypothetical protein